MLNQVDIIGPYPPPIGGISIHLARIEKLLIEFSVPYKIYNHGSYQSGNIVATNKSLLWYIKYLFLPKGKVVHFHNFFKFQFYYYFLFGIFFPNRLIITIHGEHILNSNILNQNILLFLLKQTRYLKLILVSKSFSEYLNGINIDNVFLPAYVPPTGVKPTALQPVDNKLFFMFSMWKVDKHTASKIYNIDLAFSLLQEIKSNFQMLFLIGTKADSDLGYLENSIEKHNLKNNITIYFDEQLTDYINNCKFMIRCNHEDGYGVSLQESMDLGVPAIASDVCARPSGTVLFKSNDLTDLLDKVNLVINTDIQSILSSSSKPSYHLDLLNLYQTHLASK